MEIGKLSHSLTLPFAPDSEKVEANFDKDARRGALHHRAGLYSTVDSVKCRWEGYSDRQRKFEGGINRRKCLEP